VVRLCPRAGVVDDRERRVTLSWCQCEVTLGRLVRQDGHTLFERRFVPCNDGADRVEPGFERKLIVAAAVGRRHRHRHVLQIRDDHRRVLDRLSGCGVGHLAREGSVTVCRADVGPATTVGGRGTTSKRATADEKQCQYTESEQEVDTCRRHLYAHLHWDC
jgi:hypothetical protein